MNARFQLAADSATLMQWAQVGTVPPNAERKPRTIYDHLHYPVLRRSPVHHKRELVWMREGLIPSYAHDERHAEERVEAHAEALTCDACFRSAFRRRRCLIPAEVLHEHRHVLDGRDYACSFARASGAIFGIAAVWETWGNDQGHTIETFAIVTSLVAPLLRPILDRMPVIVAAEDQDRWLDAGSNQQPPIDLLRPLSNTDLALWKMMPSPMQG